MNQEKGNVLIVALAIGLLSLLAVGTGVVVFTNVFDNFLSIKEDREFAERLMENVRETSEKNKKAWDEAVEKFSSPEVEEHQELRVPNAPFPQNPDEPLTNPLDATVPEPVLDPRHEDSIDLILPPDLGIKEIEVESTPEPKLVTCPKEGAREWVKKYVGEYIYCVVPERPCLYSSCTFSRYFLDGTQDIIVGKCQDEEYINPKSSAPLCSELGI